MVNDPSAAGLTDDQHTALYRARHLIELLHLFASDRGAFVDLRCESLAVTCDLLGELIDQAVPHLIWRQPPD